MPEISKIRISRISFRISFIFTIFPSDVRKGSNQRISGKMAEISAICQKFLDQNFQNFIPHLFHIQHICQIKPQPAKLKNREAKWQKCLPYGRNFQLSISGIKFLTYFTFIIFLSEHNLGKNARSHGRIGGVK